MWIAVSGGPLNSNDVVDELCDCDHNAQASQGFGVDGVSSWLAGVGDGDTPWLGTTQGVDCREDNIIIITFGLYGKFPPQNDKPHTRSP